MLQHMTGIILQMIQTMSCKNDAILEAIAKYEVATDVGYHPGKCSKRYPPNQTPNDPMDRLLALTAQDSTIGAIRATSNRRRTGRYEIDPPPNSQADKDPTKSNPRRWSKRMKVLKAVIKL